MIFVLFVDFLNLVYDVIELCVFIGDVEVVVVFFGLFFDYLIFIGSMLVVCYVMCVVVENFVLVMFELGGKSLVVVGCFVDL